jgi:type IV pilus assembly protein PilA
MFKTLRRGVNREDGFTLIELMVVVMIIAILIAIAIPSFLGFRKNAQDRSAQSDLRNALLAQNAHQLENGAFAPGTEAGVEAILEIEPTLQFDAEGVTGVSWAVSEGGELCLLRVSDSGTTWAIAQEPLGAARYGQESCTHESVVVGGW